MNYIRYTLISLTVLLANSAKAQSHDPLFLLSKEIANRKPPNVSNIQAPIYVSSALAGKVTTVNPNVGIIHLKTPIVPLTPSVYHPPILLHQPVPRIPNSMYANVSHIKQFILPIAPRTPPVLHFPNASHQFPPPILNTAFSINSQIRQNTMLIMATSPPVHQFTLPISNSMHLISSQTYLDKFIKHEILTANVLDPMSVWAKQVTIHNLKETGQTLVSIAEVTKSISSPSSFSAYVLGKLPFQYSQVGSMILSPPGLFDVAIQVFKENLHSEFDPTKTITSNRTIPLNFHGGSTTGQAYVTKTFNPNTGGFRETITYRVIERPLGPSMRPLGISMNRIGLGNISSLPTLNVSPWQSKMLMGSFRHSFLFPRISRISTPPIHYP
ncbi:MAG: hypothetical protein ACE5HI_03030 [bacterium]